MAVGLGSNFGAEGDLDATPISAAGLAQDDNGEQGDARGPSQTLLAAPEIQLVTAIRGAADDGLWGSEFASPIDVPDERRRLVRRKTAHGQGAEGTATDHDSTGTSSGKSAGKPGKGGGKSSGKLAKGIGKNAGAASDGSSFFGLPTGGNKVVFVVDVSGSMHGRRIRRAQTELRHTLESLKPSQQFYIVFFSDGATAMPAAGLLAATRDNVAAAWQWVKQAQCGGGTNPLPAVLMALELRPDAIYLLTDGKFPPQVLWAATEAPPGMRTPIYTIGFATKKAEKLLQAIASETGGDYRFVP